MATMTPTNAVAEKTLVKTTRFLSWIEAVGFAAEQLSGGAEAWVTYNCDGSVVVSTRRKEAL